jgi:transposase
LIRYHVGIDTGKRKHHACVHDNLEDRYTKVFSFSVDSQGFEHFLLFLRRHGPAEEMLAGVEASGPYALTIGHFLLKNGYHVVELNPFQASQFRKSQGKKAKTDRVDARSLADFLGVGSNKPLTLGDPIRESLRELTRFRVDLVTDRNSEVNRLQEALTIVFPELGSHLASLDSPSALVLLASYPGPSPLAEAGTEAVGACLAAASHGRLGSPSQAEAIVGAAQTTVGLLQRERAMALKLEILAQAILSINSNIQRVEAAIEGLFHQLSYDTHDYPAGGVQSLASILAEIDDVHRFPTLKQFLSHFGWCPQTFQSGGFQHEHPRMSHAGNRYVRRMVWMLAILAVKTVPAYKEYLSRRTAAGKKKMHTIVAVGRKLLSVIYAVLKTGRPYINPGGDSHIDQRLALTSL